MMPLNAPKSSAMREIPFEEVFVLQFDGCDCSPQLGEALSFASAFLRERLVLRTTSELSHGAAQWAAKVRYQKAEARIWVRPCEEHPIPSFLASWGKPEEIVIVSSSESLEKQAQQIEESLRLTARQAGVPLSEGMFLPFAAVAHMRSFVQFSSPSAPPVTPVPPSSLQTRIERAKHQSEPTLQSAQMWNPPSESGVSHPRAASPPMTSPQQAPSYFSRSKTSAYPTNNSYFSVPRREKPYWKWAFLLLCAGILIYAWLQWRSKKDGATDHSQPSPPASSLQGAAKTAAPQVPSHPSATPHPAPSRAPTAVRPTAAPAPRTRHDTPTKNSPTSARIPSSPDSPHSVAPAVRVVKPTQTQAVSRKERAQMRQWMRQTKRVNPRWIGGLCRNSSFCDLRSALCLPARGGGFCTLFCRKRCPDRRGEWYTRSFCVDSSLAHGTGIGSLGVCLPACDEKLFPKTGCRLGARCQSLPWRGKKGTKRRVCVPSS